jgi:hypothetical protein
MVTVLPANGEGVRQWGWQLGWGRPRLSWFDTRNLSAVAGSELLLVSAETGQGHRRLAQPTYDDTANGAMVAFNSQLTQLAYSGKNYELVVRDLASGRLLVRTDLQLDLPAGGEWSPDGHKFVFAAYDPAHPRGAVADLYVLDRSASITRLTSLSSKYDEFHILDMTWSPDQRNLAMWAQSALFDDEFIEDEWRLFVLDVIDHKFIDLCIANRLQEQGFTRWDLTWSPDSRSMLIRLQDDVPDRVVDLRTGGALVLPADTLVLLWGP